MKSNFELCSFTPNNDVISILVRKDQTEHLLTLVTEQTEADLKSRSK